MHKAVAFRPDSRIVRSLLLSFTLLTLVLGANSSSLAQIGKPWAWGYNGYGQFGDGMYVNSATPVHPQGLSNIVQVSGGLYDTLYLKSNGTVWGCGYNVYGELGDGTGVLRTTPVQVAGLTGVVQVSTNYYYSLAVKSDGTVWAWGLNDRGQLGDGTYEMRLSPVQATGLTGVVQVSAGIYHSLALKSDGTVWAWGYGPYGALGNGGYDSSPIPVQATGLSGVVQIAVGGFGSSLALKSDGTVWGWGDNQYGGLGDGTYDSRNVPVQALAITGVAQVVGGYQYTLALKSDGTVWAWGYNGHGVFGDGTTDSSAVPVQTPGLAGMQQIAATYFHNLAVKSDGTVWAWGYNGYGQIGDGTLSENYAPFQAPDLAGQTFVAAGYGHSLSVQAFVQSTKLSVSNPTQAYGSSKTTLSATLKNTTLGGTIINEPITFTLDGVAVGTANTNAAGKASLVVANSSVFTVGAHAITASFNGDSRYSASAGTGTLTVDRAATSVSVPNVTLQYGNAITLSATLKNIGAGGVVPNQYLQFVLDSVVVGTVRTNATGKASAPVAYPLTYNVGAHPIAVQFNGDSNYKASGLGTGTLTITKADVSISVGVYTARPGDTKTFTAVLKRKTDNAPLNARKLTFKIDGAVLSTATTNKDGKASISPKIGEAYEIGSHALTVDFPATDETLHNAGTGAGTLTIAQAPTKLSISSVSGKVGATVLMRAKLARTTDSGLLTGKAVRFQIDGADVGTATTASTGVDFGIASLNYTIPSGSSVGAHTITVLFDGNTFYINCTGTATLTVK